VEVVNLCKAGVGGSVVEYCKVFKGPIQSVALPRPLYAPIYPSKDLIRPQVSLRRT